jgi:hypothetical protein
MIGIATSGADDRSFVVNTADGPFRVVVSTTVPRTFVAQSHVTVTEVLDTSRSELEDAARAKARWSGSRSTVRLGASDL